MQVFGLPDHVIRTGKLASRIAAKSPDNEAAIRRAAVRHGAGAWRLVCATIFSRGRRPLRRAIWHRRHAD